MSRHGYMGREPNTPLEYMQARIEAMYEAEDKARAQKRFEEMAQEDTIEDGIPKEDRLIELEEENRRLREGKFQQGRPPEMIDFYYPDVVAKVRQDILAICKIYPLVGDAMYAEPLTRLTERIAEWVWKQLHLRECLNDGWALECDQIHAELRDCRRVLREMENETPKESRELRMTGATLYLKAINELHDSLDKCQRLEELLREAGDFMTPTAHADWKKKLERLHKEHKTDGTEPEPEPTE